MSARRVALALVFLACAWTVWTAWHIVEVANSPLAPQASGDAVVVLGAAVHGDAPSPVFAARLDDGIALVQSGRAPLLLLTGGVGESATQAESTVGRTYALARGVPSAAIRVETRSRTTEENLACIAPIVRASGADTLLLVSDPLHLRRAAALARDQGLTVITAPAPSSRYRSWRTRAPFLAREVWFSAVRSASRLVGYEPQCPES